jgi:iron(III) transport system ATP-binding protein
VIQIDGVTKVFRGRSGDTPALDSVNLEVRSGEFFVLLGSSGSGKTTLLRSIAGLEKPDDGEIRLGSQLVFSGRTKIFVPPEKRRLGMVFQSYAIWPHMTVFENIAVPLREGKAKIPRHLVRERVRRALEMVGLSGLEQRPAPLLSGGQQQRVALARALAVEPAVMLMDEPLSNLDARLREEVRREIKKLTSAINVTTLYVTHDQAEAMALADRIAIMDQGRILQIGSAEDLYMRPAHPKVAQFMGSANWFAGTVVADGVVETDLGRLRTAARQNADLLRGSAVTIAVRPEGIRLTGGPVDAEFDSNILCGHVTSETYFGDHRLYAVQVGATTLLAKLPFDQRPAGNVHLVIPAGAILVFPVKNHAGIAEGASGTFEDRILATRTQAVPVGNQIRT